MYLVKLSALVTTLGESSSLCNKVVRLVHYVSGRFTCFFLKTDITYKTVSNVSNEVIGLIHYGRSSCTCIWWSCLLILVGVINSCICWKSVPFIWSWVISSDEQLKMYLRNFSALFTTLEVASRVSDELFCLIPYVRGSFTRIWLIVLPYSLRYR